MAVPEAPVYQDNRTVPRQRDVWLAWQLGVVEAIPEARRMEGPANQQLRARVASANLPHHRAALFGCKGVHVFCPPVRRPCQTPLPVLYSQRQFTSPPATHDLVAPWADAAVLLAPPKPPHVHSTRARCCFGRPAHGPRRIAARSSVCGVFCCPGSSCPSMACWWRSHDQRGRHVRARNTRARRQQCGNAGARCRASQASPQHWF